MHDCSFVLHFFLINTYTHILKELVRYLSFHIASLLDCLADILLSRVWLVLLRITPELVGNSG